MLHYAVQIANYLGKLNVRLSNNKVAKRDSRTTAENFRKHGFQPVFTSHLEFGFECVTYRVDREIGGSIYFNAFYNDLDELVFVYFRDQFGNFIEDRDEAVFTSVDELVSSRHIYRIDGYQRRQRGVEPNNAWMLAPNPRARKNVDINRYAL